MKVEALVKKVNEIREGERLATADKWRYQSILIEAKDGEGVARWLVTVGTKFVDIIEQEGVRAGSIIEADLIFDTRENNRKFVENRVYVKDLAVISNPIA